MKCPEEISMILNFAIDKAFLEDEYHLNFFDFLLVQKIKRKDVISFFDSSLYLSIEHQIEELECYLNNTNHIFKEAYDWMGEKKASQIKDYLIQILNDAKRYEQSKKPGRKPKSANK